MGKSSGSTSRKWTAGFIRQGYSLPRKRLRLTRSRRFTHSRPILEQSPHRGLELLEIDRLRQVGVKAGFLGTLDIFLHAETGERDGWRLPGFSYLPDEVDAGAIGQTQVAEKKIEILSPDGFKRGGDTWGGLCREAAVFQQSRQGARGVAVIFHE